MSRAGIVIVAPADARWAVRAQATLTAHGLFAARLYEPKLLGLVVRVGKIGSVVADVRRVLIGGRPFWEVFGVRPRVGVVVVHEDPAPHSGEWHSIAWPDDDAAMLALFDDG